MLIRLLLITVALVGPAATLRGDDAAVAIAWNDAATDTGMLGAINTSACNGGRKPFSASFGVVISAADPRAKGRGGHPQVTSGFLDPVAGYVARVGELKQSLEADAVFCHLRDSAIGHASTPLIFGDH